MKRKKADPNIVLPPSYMYTVYWVYVLAIHMHLRVYTFVGAHYINKKSESLRQTFHDPPFSGYMHICIHVGVF